MSVSVTLQQEKDILTNTYRLVSWITHADPLSLYPLFVVSEGSGASDEHWERVATLEDLVNLVENPLTTLTAETPSVFNTAVAGDKLIINAAPASWITDTFTEAKFIVATVDPAYNYVVVQATKPFPQAFSSLAWTLKNATETEVKATGNGAGHRTTLTGSTTYLRRHWTEIFNNVQAALDRLESNKTYVRALVTQVAVHGDSYTGTDSETYTG